VNEVTGYHIEATDDRIGHVYDFIIDDESWTIRYLVVDTGKWLGGKKVLLAPGWINRIDWQERQVKVFLTHGQIEKSPDFDPSRPVNREYEVKLYDFYGRPHYWN
jgi:hypothetical protein